MRIVNRFSFLLLLLPLVLSDQTTSQTIIPDKIQFKHLTKEQGLSDDFINCIIQDRKGFIWIGTLNGLNRYDGLNFKVYRPSPDDPNSLGLGGVYALFEDKSGTLWIGTGGGGLNKYNPEQENFTRYLNPKDSSTIANYILSIYEDKSGLLWVGTQYTGLYMFDKESGKSTYYKNIPGDSASLSENRIWTFYEDSKNNLWVGTLSGGLNKFDRGRQKFTRYIHDPKDPASLSFNTVAGLREDRSGNIWIATFGGGLDRLTFKNDRQIPVFTHFKHNPYDPLSISDNYLVFIHIDKNNFMWLGTSQKGLTRSVISLDDISMLSFISYQHNPPDRSSLNGNYVSWIYEDNSGLLWIANQGEGINIFNPGQKQFRQYSHKPEDPRSLSDNSVTAVYEDKSGTLWIGTRNGGLNKWDKTTNRFTHYLHNPYDMNSLSNNRVTAIHEDKSGILWVGTYFGGLNKFNRTTEKFYAYKHDPLNPRSIGEDVIVSIAEDRSGNLWIGTPDNGLYKFEIKSGNFTHINYNSDISDSLSSTWADALYMDRNDVLWISAKDDGVYVYDPHKNKFLNYRHDPSNQNSLSDNTVNVIYEDKSGFIWFGTKDGGLNKYDRKNNRFRHYRTKDGLPGDCIMGILEDDKSNLWISTDDGLSKFNPQTETFRNYDAEDGIPGNEFDELSCYKSKTGELIFGTNKGLIIFYADSIKDNPHTPPVYITDFYLFNKRVQIGYDTARNRTILPKSIMLCDEIELNYDDNVFSFVFAALDYYAPLKNKYAYRMEGFDRHWIYTDAARTLASYTNLDPGKYVFRVRGSNNDGIWNENGASIKIIILPPWWKTTWAYFFYILFIGSAVYSLWQLQLKRIRIRHEFEISKFEAQKLLEVDELKSRFFTNISHEFRTPLTLILGPAKQLLEKTKDADTAENLKLIHRNAKKLNKLVDELLDISKIEAGEMKLNTRPINIISLVRDIVFPFYSFAERKKITLNLKYDEPEIIGFLDKEKAEKILNNILSNAFKFTPEGGKIELGVLRTDKTAEIIISDSGIGIPPDQIDKIFDRFYQVDGSHTREHEGTGIGLSLTKELVELHKGKIEVESKEGKGTTFTVKFPLGREHLKPEEIIESDLVYEEQRTEQEYGAKEVIKAAEETRLSDGGNLPLLLIIEDNADVRFYIKNNLNKEYRVAEAGDGEEGWNKSIEQIPDLIISDVMMPKIDGFKLCEKLKNDERTSHIPIILLTAKAARENKLEGYEMGADDYIMKPFEPEELKARIKNLIEQRRRLHEHFQKKGLFELPITKINPVDKKFIEKVYETIINHISDASLNLDTFAGHLNISKSLLHKKIVSLVGEPPGELIRRVRLQKAAELIENKFGNLSEIALEVGFNNPSYFSECFKKQFGVAPSQYIRINKKS